MSCVCWKVPSHLYCHSIVMACTGKVVVLLSVIGLMVLIPLGMFVTAELAPYFYSSRAKLIKT